MKQPLLIPVLHEGKPAYQLVEEFEGIPKGLIVDGASIPRILWSYKPPDGIHRGPCLHHDWDYQNKGFNPYWTRWPWDPTRKICDNKLHGRLLEAGLKNWDAHVMWKGVRGGGWYVWQQPKRDPVILQVRNAAPLEYMSDRQRALFAAHLYS